MLGYSLGFSHEKALIDRKVVESFQCLMPSVVLSSEPFKN